MYIKFNKRPDGQCEDIKLLQYITAIPISYRPSSLACLLKPYSYVDPHWLPRCFLYRGDYHSQGLLEASDSLDCQNIYYLTFR